MPPLPRDALVASIAAALGVSPLACGAEAPAAATQPVMAAREVPAFTPAEAGPDPSLDAGASSPGVAALDDAGGPEASTLADLAPVPPPPPPGVRPVAELPLGLLVATALPRPPPPPAPKPRPPLPGQTVCGASCGASVQSPRSVPVARIEARLGLQPRPGLNGAEREQAQRVLDQIGLKLRRCAASALNALPLDHVAPFVVVLHAPGHGGPTALQVTSELDPSFDSCLRTALAAHIGGDEAAVTLRFPAELVFR